MPIRRPDGSGLRLFTGLEVPAPVADELMLVRGGLAGARWIEREDLHLTLRFIGDIDRATGRDVVDALAGLEPGPAVEVTLTGLAAFGGARPHSLIALAAPSVALGALQEAHEAAMRRIGLPPDSRRFTPHVTLARLRKVTDVQLAAFMGERPLPPLRFTAHRAALYSARLSTGGGPYVVEAAYPLG